MRTNAIVRDFMEPFDWFIFKRVCNSENRDCKLCVFHAHEKHISCDEHACWTQSPLKFAKIIRLEVLISCDSGWMDGWVD